MNTERLKDIVERYVALNEDIKAAQDEQKELADAAYDQGLVRSANHQDARKVVKKLAKETGWDEIQREAQRLMEEALDECRSALGLLAGLPLGEAAVKAASVTSPAVRADGTVKRGPGRPKGARNKPKAAANGNGHAAPPPPNIPDMPTDGTPEYSSDAWSGGDGGLR